MHLELYRSANVGSWLDGAHTLHNRLAVDTHGKTATLAQKPAACYAALRYLLAGFGKIWWPVGSTLRRIP